MSAVDIFLVVVGAIIAAPVVAFVLFWVIIAIIAIVAIVVGSIVSLL